MDKSDRETLDFMNVQSFSQLPFIRPPPLKEKPVKLFGIEFPNSDSPSAPDDADSAETANNNAFDLDNKDSTATADNGESSRRFECHYCCRNFPTSQALGGHQNAHKRERQHAKRAHLQSAMVHNGLSVDAAQVYGLMNYRLGSAPAQPISYPTWHNSNSSSGRLYGSHGASSYPHLQPINGSPLALWRIPTVQSNPTALNRDRSLHLQHPLPLFAGDEINVRTSPVVVSASQNRLVYDSKPTVQDHVSLDLHL